MILVLSGPGHCTYNARCRRDSSVCFNTSDGGTTYNASVAMDGVTRPNNKNFVTSGITASGTNLIQGDAPVTESTTVGFAPPSNWSYDGVVLDLLGTTRVYDFLYLQMVLKFLNCGHIRHLVALL